MTNLENPDRIPIKELTPQQIVDELSSIQQQMQVAPHGALELLSQRYQAILASIHPQNLDNS